MDSQYLHKKRLPDTPGVYFFMGPRKEIFYIGKATSLKSRVRSYFAPDLSDTRGSLIVQMVADAKGLDFHATDSVLEAILLEADLIKKFQPRFNTKEKSDKSFNCVVITKEDFPRILLVRKKDLAPVSLDANGFKLKEVFGPFPNGTLLKDALRIVRKIFPYRDSKCVPGQGKPCFNRQIGLCPGVCTGEISKTDYARTITHLSLFFSGKKKNLLATLTREMKIAAKAREFERAGNIKKTIFALQHIQDVSLLKRDRDSGASGASHGFRIEAYDVAHISGTDAVGVMTVVEDGLPNKAEYRKFKIQGDFGNNDVASLNEIVERRLGHSDWPLPQLFVADGGAVQQGVVEEALKRKNISIPVVAVTKDVRHRPEKILGDTALVKAHERAILLANNEAHRFAITFHRARRGRLIK